MLKDENIMTYRSVEMGFAISEGVKLVLRVLLPAIKDAAEKSENKIDDALVKILEEMLK